MTVCLSLITKVSLWIRVPFADEVVICSRMVFDRDGLDFCLDPNHLSLLNLKTKMILTCLNDCYGSLSAGSLTLAAHVKLKLVF